VDFKDFITAGGWGERDPLWIRTLEIEYFFRGEKTAIAVAE
jgi:hypothetical protein